MDFELTKSQTEIQRAARDFAKGEFDPELKGELERTGDVILGRRRNPGGKQNAPRQPQYDSRFPHHSISLRTTLHTPVCRNSGGTLLNKA